MDINTGDPSPIIPNLEDFDRNSGSVLERLLFNHRPAILILCLLATMFLGFEAIHLNVNASFNKMIPVDQPFIVNYIHHYEDLQSQSNAIRVVVEANHGTIIDARYLSVLREINDEVFVLPGVNRGYMTSLWTPATRWLAETPDGLTGGPVIDQQYDGSPAQLDIVRQNIAKAGEVGQLVGGDYKSSMIYVPLMDVNNLTGQPLNYGQLARQLNQIRQKYSSQGVTLHIVGFAMVVGDIIDGINKILIFFAVSVVFASAMLFWYTRCVRSTALVVSASLVAVVWQLGFLPLLGFDLNPYSVLVPFLIFAIGMSHGAQKMNGVMQDVGRGAHPLIAARYTFRRLFLAGFSALTCDAASFAVLMTIKIEAIRELALIASIGVAILVFTNLIMLPMLLSYTGVSQKAAIRSMRNELSESVNVTPHRLWRFLDLFTTRRWASIAIFTSVLLGCFGWYVGRNVQVGDLNQGAPELRADSQYNTDNGYMISHYSVGSDTLIVMIDTKPSDCEELNLVDALNALEWKLDQLPQVQSTSSLGSFVSNTTMLLTENSPKWDAIIPNQESIEDLSEYVPPALQNLSCTYDSLYVSLKDHKASTLATVVKTIQNFIANPENQGPDLKCRLPEAMLGSRMRPILSSARPTFKCYTWSMAQLSFFVLLLSGHGERSCVRSYR